MYERRERRVRETTGDKSKRGCSAARLLGCSLLGCSLKEKALIFVESSRGTNRRSPCGWICQTQPQRRPCCNFSSSSSCPRSRGCSLSRATVLPPPPPGGGRPLTTWRRPPVVIRTPRMRSSGPHLFCRCLTIAGWRRTIDFSMKKSELPTFSLHSLGQALTSGPPYQKCRPCTGHSSSKWEATFT